MSDINYEAGWDDCAKEKDALLAASKAEIERLRGARNELVVAIHSLASHFENALYAFRDDDEARKKAEGDIAWAMEIAGRHNHEEAADEIDRLRKQVLDDATRKQLGLGETGAKALADAKEEIARLRGELDAAALEAARLERLVWTPMNAYPEIKRLRGLLREWLDRPGIIEHPTWRKVFDERVREALGE